MQVVDSPLQRDGKVDEILLAAAEEDELRAPDRPQLPESAHRDQRRDPRGGRGSDRNPLGR
jgi:hypothetical protein